MQLGGLARILKSFEMIGFNLSECFSIAHFRVLKVREVPHSISEEFMPILESWNLANLGLKKQGLL